MTDGINLTGFNETKLGNTNSIDAHYSDNTGSAFAASDVSAQGNAGLNREGSSSSLPISGADESDDPATYRNM
jgi:hypothetical protein